MNIQQVVRGSAESGEPLKEPRETQASHSQAITAITRNQQATRFVSEALSGPIWQVPHLELRKPRLNR